MALSKSQIEDQKPWKKFFIMSERDILWLAGKYEGWLDIAVDLGFTVEKVMKPWPFADGGRKIRVMTWEELFTSMRKV